MISLVDSNPAWFQILRLYVNKRCKTYLVRGRTELNASNNVVHHARNSLKSPIGRLSALRDFE